MRVVYSVHFEFSIRVAEVEFLLKFIVLIINTSKYPIRSVGTKNDIKLTALDRTVVM